MRIAVIAAGAVGGYFGARLAAAGHDVAFIARGAHRDAIRREGLRIESSLGDLHLKGLPVTDEPQAVDSLRLPTRFVLAMTDTEFRLLRKGAHSQRHQPEVLDATEFGAVEDCSRSAFSTADIGGLQVFNFRPEGFLDVAPGGGYYRGLRSASQSPTCEVINL